MNLHVASIVNTVKRMKYTDEMFLRLVNSNGGDACEEKTSF